MTDINYHDPEHKDITILYIYINFKHLCEGAIKTLPISITPRVYHACINFGSASRGPGIKLPEVSVTSCSARTGPLSTGSFRDHVRTPGQCLSRYYDQFRIGERVEP